MKTLLNSISKPYTSIFVTRFELLRHCFTAIALYLPTLAVTSVSAETIATSRVPGVAPPACAEETQIALNSCAVQWSRTADFLRSLVYEELFWRVSEQTQAQLITTEQAWNSFRDVHCQEASEGVRGGSIYPLVYHTCRARVANDRIADLQRLSNSEITLSGAAQRLNSLLNQSGLSNNNAQRLWQRYQELHCQFEMTRLAQQSPLSSQPSGQRSMQPLEECRQRLAGARIRQVEMMNFNR
jgi:uncharacterized protein YecT (DUF1311 family)